MALFPDRADAPAQVGAVGHGPRGRLPERHGGEVILDVVVAEVGQQDPPGRGEVGRDPGADRQREHGHPRVRGLRPGHEDGVVAVEDGGGQDSRTCSATSNSLHCSMSSTEVAAR